MGYIFSPFLFFKLDQYLNIEIIISSENKRPANDLLPWKLPLISLAGQYDSL